MLSQVSLQEKGTRRRQQTEDGRVKAEAETGWIGPEAEEAAAPRSYKRQGTDSPLETAKRAQPVGQPDFGLPVSRE